MSLHLVGCYVIAKNHSTMTNSLSLHSLEVYIYFAIFFFSSSYSFIANNPPTSYSSRKSNHHRPTGNTCSHLHSMNLITFIVSPLSSSNSSPYPSSWGENHSDKPDDSEFPTLTSDDTINKRNEGRSAWSNPHLIKEKVLSPTRVDQVSHLDTGPSPEDIEFERLKALVPKQRTTTRKIGNRLSSASPSPSSSSSSSHHHHRNRNHQHHLQSHPHHRTSKSSSTNLRATTSRAHSLRKDPSSNHHHAIVKISTSTNTTKRVSSDSGSSSSSSSNYDIASQSLVQPVSDPKMPPSSSTAATTPPTPPTTSTSGHLWVDEQEKQHFLSWLYTWTCQPGIEWKKDAHALHHHGEYSYFGPLGTKSDASLFYQGNILVHSPWYNYS